jgi:hypothetical protein
MTYTEDKLDAIKEALVKFQQKNDTKASAIVSMSYSSDPVCSVTMASLFDPN